MQKGFKFKGIPICQEELMQLRHWLTTALIVSFSDYNLPFHLYTDVSLIAIRAVLTQVRHDREHIIACASSSLTTLEMNYAATKNDCLGIE